MTGNFYVSIVIDTFSERGFLLFSTPPTMEEEKNIDEARAKMTDFWGYDVPLFFVKIFLPIGFLENAFSFSSYKSNIMVSFTSNTNPTTNYHSKSQR